MLTNLGHLGHYPSSKVYLIESGIQLHNLSSDTIEWLTWLVNFKTEILLLRHKTPTQTNKLQSYLQTEFTEFSSNTIFQMHCGSSYDENIANNGTRRVFLFEPEHDKTNEMTCAPSEDSDHPPSLIRVFTVRMSWHWVLRTPSVDSDQTGWMPRLIWVFAAHACHFVGFVMLWLIWKHWRQ